MNIELRWVWDHRKGYELQRKQRLDCVTLADALRGVVRLQVRYGNSQFTFSADERGSESFVETYEWSDWQDVPMVEIDSEK